MDTGNLIIDFLDVYGERPDDQVDVTLKHAVLNQSVHLKNQPTNKRLRITELDSTHGGRFNLQVFPFRHRPVSRFVRVLEDKTVQQSIVLPIDPERVIRVECPSFESLGDDLKAVLQASSVEGNEDKLGAELYNGMDDARKAGMLNIYAKMKNTGFSNGRDTFSYVLSFSRVRGDRLFAKVARELRDEVKNSTHTGLFREVSGALHVPPPGWMSAESFKTPDVFGNLQLTFFTQPETLEFMCDVDIDDVQAIEHLFQVFQPVLATSPFDVHEILLEFQKIDPGYKLIV